MNVDGDEKGRSRGYWSCWFGKLSGCWCHSPTQGMHHVAGRGTASVCAVWFYLPGCGSGRGPFTLS